MANIISYGVIIFLVILCVSESISRAIRDKTLVDIINKVLYYLSIFLTLLLFICNLETIFKYIYSLSFEVNQIGVIDSNLFKVILLICNFLLLQLVLFLLLKLLFLPFCIRHKFKSKCILCLLSMILGAAKSVLLILITFIAIITYNSTIASKYQISAFDNIKAYNELRSIMINEKDYVVEDNGGSENATSNNIIVFYNGVTLEDGIKSSKGIDDKAKELTQNIKTDREKARAIYNWIGTNIEYDFKKAKAALNNEKLDGSGAIEAWTSKRGICFDFACLYVAMARSSDLQVRLVTGSAFDGKSYGPHAWNEVYLKEEDLWIPVDSTFFEAGNYFDNSNFYDDHIKENIAGQWKSAN